ncbi:uncharacterized protein K441DRAFT_135281 [Cenococcum geophilum 1.58]|uniref:uncharacterized protein n=1 Tax=Cenococcum geophilum 1.58 TaxID=794803 RepID=UPI00358FC693|nr:hypothetical protein K441DRAFT_135281 [Cenococcum geophilum 1.58]
MINFTSEKRKTQIDFNGLGLSPRLETDVLDQATQTPAGKEHGLGNRENPKQDAAKTSTRKRSLSPEEGGLEKRAGLKPLRLPEVVRSGIGAHEYLKTMHGSPWETHVKLFDIRLDEDDIFVTVAERQNAQHGTLIWKDPFSDLALVRSFSGQGMRTSFDRFGIPILSLLLILLKFSDSKGIVSNCRLLPTR